LFYFISFQWNFSWKWFVWNKITYATKLFLLIIKTLNAVIHLVEGFLKYKSLRQKQTSILYGGRLLKLQLNH
jgi:hypothetical protein